MTKHYEDFDSIDPSRRAKIVKGSVIPRPIAWVTSLNPNGSVNLAPFSFFTALSPTLLAVSFQKNENFQKDTFLNIIREQEAVIHLVDESLIDVMDQTSFPLEFGKSEMELVNLTVTSSNKIKTPGIKEALIRFEVKLESTLELKDYDHKEGEADLVILRVIAAEMDDQVFDEDKAYVLAEKLNPIARLGGNAYAGIKILDYKRKF